jgi:hypothetical protein
MGEWFMEWHEDDDIDLMLAALAHEEELHQQQLEQEARRYPVVITPRVFIHELHSSSTETIHSVLGMPGVQQTISPEPSRTNHLRRRFTPVW